jgi:hypothetical protein
MSQAHKKQSLICIVIVQPAIEPFRDSEVSSLRRGYAQIHLPELAVFG